MLQGFGVPSGQRLGSGSGSGSGSGVPPPPPVIVLHESETVPLIVLHSSSWHEFSKVQVVSTLPALLLFWWKCTLPPAYAGVAVSGIDASAASDAATTRLIDKILKFMVFPIRHNIVLNEYN